MNRLERGVPYFEKGRLTMKSKWPARIAAIALGLFLATWFPASAAADKAKAACDALRQAGADALKPGSVSVVKYQGGPDALLSWGLAATQDPVAFTGWCSEKKHVSSGRSREECYSQIGIRFARHNSCVGVNDCPRGAFEFRVKLQNGCGLQEPWSDAVEFEFSENVTR
ncbi:MAG: hypothetical protein OXU81_15735 [Gammaproteobacteria bacterium]|nr:hypothetical protein [Gammaproteobacteria bacterium]